MNVSSVLYAVVREANFFLPDRRMGIWKAYDASRKAAQAPTLAGEDTTRAGPGKSQARKPGEEAHTRCQKERKSKPNGGLQNPSQRSG